MGVRFAFRGEAESCLRDRFSNGRVRDPKIQAKRSAFSARRRTGRVCEQQYVVSKFDPQLRAAVRIRISVDAQNGHSRGRWYILREPVRGRYGRLSTESAIWSHWLCTCAGYRPGRSGDGSTRRLGNEYLLRFSVDLPVEFRSGYNATLPL